MAETCIFKLPELGIVLFGYTRTNAHSRHLLRALKGKRAYRCPEARGSWLLLFEFVMGLPGKEEGAIPAGFILNGITFLSISDIWRELTGLFSFLSVPPQL